MKNSEFDFVSLPIYQLKSNNKKYKCGDNFEQFIDFRNEPNLQYIFISKNGIQIHETIGFHEHPFWIQELSALNDTSEYPFFYKFAFSLIKFKSNRVAKNIIKYKLKNKYAHLFMIIDIEGVWSVENGRVYKLSSGIFKDIRKVKGNKEFNRYGEDLINNIIEGKGWGVGIYYKPCKKKRFNNKRIFIDIK